MNDILNCLKCNNLFKLEKSNLNKKYCSQSCANSHIRTDESKQKTRETMLMKSIYKVDFKICEFCNQLFTYQVGYEKRFCSRSCSSKFKYKDRSERGLLPSRVNYKRSKNEIYFSELCKQYFGDKSILTNESIFNGWDVDIIIPHLKLAIHWNGAWHYKKIHKNHSLEQVQNRDKIKLVEIESFGYQSYIIRDDGCEDKKFVESEFEKFKKQYMQVDQVIHQVS